MNLFEHLASFIIRPHRHDYKLNNLGKHSTNAGPNNIELTSKVDGSELRVVREDRIVRNRNGYRLQLSHYLIQNRTSSSYPTIIYLHANNGSRI